MADLTDNLKLSKINSSDFVDPEVFNDNFDILDKLGVDYITEQGQSGEWFYRKYKSGTAECWARIDFPATTATGDVHSNFNFPFSFSKPPVVTLSAGVALRSGSHISYVQSSEVGVDCYINKDTNANNARWLYCHAIGTVSQ